MSQLIFYVIIFLLLVFLIIAYKYIMILRERIDEIESRKISNAVRHGQIFEQLIPFSEKFPFDPKNFKFLGNPVDGVVFEDDKIIFVEIKLNQSRLSKKQKNIKELVNNKKVFWYEVNGK